MKWENMLVITFCGLAMLLTIWLGQPDDLAVSLGAGLIGFLGGKLSN